MVAGNKLESLGDIQQLQLCQRLVTLDLYHYQSCRWLVFACVTLTPPPIWLQGIRWKAAAAAALPKLNHTGSVALSQLQVACLCMCESDSSAVVVSGNKLESLGDIQQLQHCQSLVTLDLSSNRLSQEEAVHLVMTLPLSLLKLNGNSVVSHMR